MFDEETVINDDESTDIEIMSIGSISEIMSNGSTDSLGDHTFSSTTSSIIVPFTEQYFRQRSLNFHGPDFIINKWLLTNRIMTMIILCTLSMMGISKSPLLRSAYVPLTISFVNMISLNSNTTFYANVLFLPPAIMAIYENIKKY